MQNLLQEAVRLHQMGQFPQAESLYEQSIRVNPQNPNAYNLLGVLKRQLRLDASAIPFITRAIALNPGVSDFHFNLGEALRATNRFTEAQASYETALGLAGPDPEIFHCLGMVLAKQGKPEQAISYLQKALQLAPWLIAAYDDLAHCMLQLDRPDEALRLSQRALDMDPSRAESHFNLGSILARSNNPEAISAFMRATQLRPIWPEAHLALAVSLGSQGRVTDAIDACRRAIALKHDYAEAHNTLGTFLNRIGRQAESITAFQNALRLNPDNANTLSNLAGALKEQALIDDAILTYRRALQMNPNLLAARSNYLLCLNCDSKIDSASLFSEHLAFGSAISRSPRQLFSSNLITDRNPDRQLRIGYLSPDLREHPVASFLEPILASHDAVNFQIVCYSDTVLADATTQRLQKYPHLWRQTSALSDQQLAELIRADRIDILIELAGHTANNRLPMFALRPTPIAMTYLGYANTTGLPPSIMQWRITDHVADPPGLTEAHHSEQLIRLPDCFLCYRPPESAPAVEPPPSEKTGQITFGSFNQLAKVSCATLDHWSRVLHAVPNSRLLLKSKSLGEEKPRQLMQSAFEALGISPQRLILEGYQPSVTSHLARYNEVDIALDTFPYQGTTTTCEALYMGVPLITLTGDTHRARVGTSILKALGLSELIARDSQTFVTLAAQLAQNLSLLRDLRLNLREIINSSRLTDAPRFTKNMQQIYRDAWQKYCNSDA